MGDDEADTEVFYDMLNCLYAHHPIRTHIAGTAESISHITDQTLYTCHGAFYNPANMVLTVVGDVDPEGVMAIAKEVVTGEGKGNPGRDYGDAEPKTPVKQSSKRQMAVSIPLFMLGFKLPPPTSGEDRLRSQLLGDLAGDLLLGESSPLFERLYESGLITRNFSGGYENYTGCAFFAAGGESKDPEAVKEEVLAEARRLATEGIPEERFRRCKRAAYGSMVTGLNSFENTAVELAQNYFNGADYLTFPEIFEGITPQDVQSFLANFTAEQAALAVVEPGGEDA